MPCSLRGCSGASCPARPGTLLFFSMPWPGPYGSFPSDFRFPGCTGKNPVIDNKQESRFEREENGLLAWASYRTRDGQSQLPHVEADPLLRGTGAAGRLMQEVVE